MQTRERPHSYSGGYFFRMAQKTDKNPKGITMFSVAVCFGPAATVWALLYKEEEGATKVFDSLNDAIAVGGSVGGSDDFGQKFVWAGEQLHGVMFEDLELSQLGQIERGLHQARVQAKAQTRAAGDPTIKASMMAQGPAAFMPGIPRQ